jgi:hypothetical protein
MTAVRQSANLSEGFNPMPSHCLVCKPKTPLPKHNGPQKPGRATAPREPRSPIASAPRDLGFAHPRSLQSVPRDVFGRWSGSSSTNTMTDTTAAEIGTGSRTSRSYTPYTSGGGPEVYEKIARWRRGIAACTLRTLRFETRVCNTHGVPCLVHILPSENEVYEVYGRASPPRRPREISYTSKIAPKCTKCTSAATSGGIVNA